MEGKEMYYNIKKGLGAFPKLISAETPAAAIIGDENTNDWYQSIFFYNKDQFEFCKKNGTLKGIDNTITNKLIFDFDYATDLSKAQKDTVSLAKRLIDEGFNEDAISASFSGAKGFGIEVQLDRYINNKKWKQIVMALAKDLDTFDTTIYDPQRIIRICNTKHQKSGLYKIPLELYELDELNANEIKQMAIKPRALVKVAAASVLPEKYVNIPEEVKTEVKSSLSFDINELKGQPKPKYMDEARWYLVNGFFKHSERQTAMLCVAATYQNLGYSREHVFSLMSAVADMQSKRTDEGLFSEDRIVQILDNVFSDNWKGGQFTTRDPSNWLYQYANKMGIGRNRDDVGPQTMDRIEDTFTHFLMNIEKNTIKTGIDELDRLMPITVGSNIGIVAAAGVGKTALALQILKHNSEQGIVTVLASLDMTRHRLFEKVLYNVTGMSREILYETFKRGEGKKLTELVKKHYGNVWFYDRSSASILDIKNYIQEVEQSTGQKVKMVLIDYLERVSSDISDDTASSKKVAGEIQDLVSDCDVAAITLCQPNKFSLGGGPDTEIKSYTSIKGSSFLYQSFRGIISLSRPFYTPALKEYDKFCILNILKNDLGEIGRLELGWNGKRGNIYPLEDIERQELHEFMKMKEETKNGGHNSAGWD